MSLMDRFKFPPVKPIESLSRQWQDQVEGLVQGAGEFVQGMQEELGVVDEMQYEWHRLQTFVGWPLETPRAIELAKAGFYFTPTDDAPDGCAHFCTDKFFSAWEEDDDPWTVLKDNCPDCPIISGTSRNVPLPYSYNPADPKAPPPSQAKPKDEKPSRNLGSYLTGAVERVGTTGPGSPEAASPQMHVPYTLGAAAAGLGRFWGSGGASERSASPQTSEPAQEEAADVGDLQVTSKVKRKGKKGAGKPKPANQAAIEEDPVYSQIFDAGAGDADFPPAVAPAAQPAAEEEWVPAPMATGSMQEWASLRVSVMGSVARMKAEWEGQLTKLDARLTGIKGKVHSLSGKVHRLAQEDWLQAKRRTIDECSAELASRQKAIDEKQALLAELESKVQASSTVVAKLAKQEELTAESEKRVQEADRELAALNESKIVLQKELEMLAIAKESMGAETEKEKRKLHDSMEGIRTSQREAEANLIDLQDTIERRKREIEMYEGKLEEFGRREEKLNSRQTEMDARERGIKSREADVKSREEWLLMKEGQQRAAGDRRKLTPRGSTISPRVTRDGLAPIDQELESRLEEAEEEDDMDSKREEMLARFAAE